MPEHATQRVRLGGLLRGLDQPNVLALLIAALLGAPSACGQNPQAPLQALSLEQLTQVQVYSASGYLQLPARAPASVTVVTARDIQTFGYRTLAEILRSVRSLFVTADRNYSSLGVRGIARPGDYNTRVLLLIDGHRMNDDVYDQAMVGTEFPLDVDLIDRVEVVRGPVSSLYGSNALLGVINVITRRGQDLQGFEVAALAGSFNTGQLRLSYGAHHGQYDLLATTTLYRSKGQRTLFFPAFDSPSTHNGIAHHLDHDQVTSAFVSASRGDLTLHALFGTRNKQIPTAPYDTVFNNPGTRTIDSHTMVDLEDEHALTSSWKVQVRGFYDIYHYAGTYAYASDATPSQPDPEIDLGYGQWAGAELKATRTGPKSTWISGAEFRDNFRQNQKTYDRSPYVSQFNDQRASFVTAPYVQYEGPLAHRLSINGGIRYDFYSDTEGSWDPRLALIYEPCRLSTLRLTYGASFRAPNVYERFYAVAPNAANPGLRPEHVRTLEALWDQKLPRHLTLSSSVFHTGVTGLITEEGDVDTSLLTFENARGVVSNGVEAELSARYAKGSSLDLSYTFQQTRDQTTDLLLSNSPRTLAKLSASTPAVRGWTVSANAQYVARMDTVGGGSVSPYSVVNATVLSPTLWKQLNISASAFNLLDKQYSDPAPNFNQQQAIPQDGRSLRIKLTWRMERR